MCHNQQITVKLNAPSDHKNTMNVPRGKMVNVVLVPRQCPFARSSEIRLWPASMTLFRKMQCEILPDVGCRRKLRHRENLDLEANVAAGTDDVNEQTNVLWCVKTCLVGKVCLYPPLGTPTQPLHPPRAWHPIVRSCVSSTVHRCAWASS